MSEISLGFKVWNWQSEWGVRDTPLLLLKESERRMEEGVSDYVILNIFEKVLDSDFGKKNNFISASPSALLWQGWDINEEKYANF